jgi:hypothetical protein
MMLCAVLPGRISTIPAGVAASVEKSTPSNTVSCSSGSVAKNESASVSVEVSVMRASNTAPTTRAPGSTSSTASNGRVMASFVIVPVMWNACPTSGSPAGRASRASALRNTKFAPK